LSVRKRKHVGSEHEGIVEHQNLSGTVTLKQLQKIICHENVMEVICAMAGFCFGDVSSV
jgi:hypothetical protein